FNLKNESFELVRTQFADISLEPDVRERCKLNFFTDEHTLPISFDADVVFAPSFKEKRNRMFLRANLFCIELAFKSENINNLSLTEIEISSSLYLTDTKATEIDEILNFFRLYNAFNLFGNISCDIHFVKSDQHLQLKVGVIHELPCTKILVESMECLKSKYRLDGRNITTIDDIYKDRNGISMLSCIVCNRTDEMNVKVNDIDKFSAGNKKIPFTIVIQLGAVAIGAVSLLYLEHIENNNFKVVRSEVVKTLIFNDGMPKREQLIEIEKQALNHLHD
ncbi:MAG TPA: hypothetical protein VJ795_00550, partial [Rheinheimera sp.]|uniref:hypothetical protein n=1 Tax=Rheinheimera sp. TaxID=1869214 RepID=UPI002B46D350